MRVVAGDIRLSASDLVGHINCASLTSLDLKVARGILSKPLRWDPLLDILRERGFRHERAFIEHLRSRTSSIFVVEGSDNDERSVAATLGAMKSGAEIIVQASLSADRWAGRADILQRVEMASELGNWSYEVIDTKLARETKGGTVLQLCLYSEMLGRMQNATPELAHVVAPWTDFKPKSFRLADYAAYFRKAKKSLELATLTEADHDLYPHPIDHCDVCRWGDTCDKRRRDDDHLSFVAGISRNQINELKENGITTLAGLASFAPAVDWKPKRGASQSYEKVQRQALLQFQARQQVRPHAHTRPHR